MQCNCQIVNNTDRVITYAALGHSTVSLSEGSPIQKVLTTNHLEPKAVSENAPANQASLSLDFWTMLVRFEGDDNTYLLFNGVLPGAECETPADGAASLHITGYGDPGSVRIDTFNDYNYTSFDGSCNEQLESQSLMISGDPGLAPLIAYVISILGE